MSVSLQSRHIGKRSSDGVRGLWHLQERIPVPVRSRGHVQRQQEEKHPNEGFQPYEEGQLQTAYYQPDLQGHPEGHPSFRELWRDVRYKSDCVSHFT